MSEELRRGIPKAIPTGKKIEFTEEEKKRNRMEFEKFLKEKGVLKENETLRDVNRSGDTDNCQKASK